MKSSIITASVTLILFLCAFSGEGQNRMMQWETESYCMETGEKGTTFIEVHSVSRKYKMLSEQAKKMAVFAVLFNGVSANRHVGCDTIYPLIRDKSIIAKQWKFFKKFFADYGGYTKYVSMVDTQGKYELVKMRGKGWRMGHQVSVYTDMLYADLKAQNIITD